MSIKCIVFDIGGVLLVNGTQNAINTLKIKYNISYEILNDIFYGTESFNVREGTITEENYWNTIYLRYPQLNYINLRSIWYDSYFLNKKVCSFLLELKKKYILGIYSDNIPERVNHFKRKYKFFRYFSFEIYSYQIGRCKLNKGSFKALNNKITQLNLLQKEVLFVDDNEECITVASSNGYNTFKYSTEIDLKTQISKYL